MVSGQPGLGPGGELVRSDPASTVNKAEAETSQVTIKCVGVVGLGYVGLSLAAAFGRVLPTIGFDVNSQRVRELQVGNDRNGDISQASLAGSHIRLTADSDTLKESDFLVVAVPTSVGEDKRPDLSNLTSASRFVAKALKNRHAEQNPTNGVEGSSHGGKPIVVYESTVYPGCIEELCIPLLEKESGLAAGQDFLVGYSPERINPGDPDHTFERVVKVVSAQDPDTLEAIAQVYGTIAKAGIYKAPNIMTAESAKVIENIQRDVNIALMNELAMLFNQLELDTQEILKAACTKWNFLPFYPGLVGGECIPVNPYYLAYKAEAVGFEPDVILSGRRINDGMGAFVAQQTVKCLSRAEKAISGAKVLVLGLAFKENVRDTRNSRVFEMVRELESAGCQVSMYDPVVGADKVEELSFKSVSDPFADQSSPDRSRYDAVVLAVPHDIFPQTSIQAYVDLLGEEGEPGVIVDVKNVLPKPAKDSQVHYWSL